MDTVVRPLYFGNCYASFKLLRSENQPSAVPVLGGGGCRSHGGVGEGMGRADQSSAN